MAHLTSAPVSLCSTFDLTSEQVMLPNVRVTAHFPPFRLHPVCFLGWGGEDENEDLEGRLQ